MKTRRLTKEQLKNKPMGQIVVEDYCTTEIFVSYGLDYCCQGNKTVEEACNMQGIETESVLNDLVKIYRLPIIRQEISMEPDPTFIVKYIINQRHQLLIPKIRQVEELLRKKPNGIADLNPAFYEVCIGFLDLCEELELHIRQEEDVVFSLIANLMDGKIDKSIFDEAVIKALVNNTCNDHEHIGKLIDHIRNLENRLIPPEIFDTLAACEVIAGTEGRDIPDEICSFYRVLHTDFGVLEGAIRESVHLENNVFFPNLTRYLEMN